MSDVEENSVASGEQEEKIEVNIAEETTKVREQFKEGLTTLSKTADNSSYAYVHLNASEKEIENVYEALQFYPHVRYLNLSTNQIKEVPHIEKMHSLLLAELQSNTIESALFTGLPNHLVYLQSLNLNQNRIKELPESLQLPRLKKLSLNENEITSLSFLEGHKSLVTLEARKNQLVNLVGLCRLPRLTEIFLAENSIASFKGIGILPKLTFLHLRNNHIKIIPDDLIDQPKLVKLNLRENAIDVKEETLKLLNLSKLNDLSLQENPFEETLDGDARRNLIMLICLDKEKGAQIRNNRIIKRINKEEIDTEEELPEIIEELKQIIAEEEEQKRVEMEERKAAEEEARIAEAEAKKEAEEQARLEAEEAAQQEGGEDEE